MFGAVAACGDNTPAHKDGGEESDGGDASMDTLAEAGGDAGDAGDARDAADGGDAGDARDAADGGDGGGMLDARDGGDASDATDTGADVPVACYATAFGSPTDGAMLTVADDKDHDNCGNGFQIDVHVTTAAPDAADVNLFVGNMLVGSAQASGGQATFTSIRLLAGDSLLSIQYPSTSACSAASTKAMVHVDCTVPTVQIIAPLSDAPLFADMSKRLLAATATQTFRDQSGSVPGAQADVVACSSTAGSASLFVGHAGDPSLAQVGSSVSTVAAAASDGCPTGLGFVARFSGASLLESTENGDGTLAAATEIRVDVAPAAGAAIRSTPVDLWVDSVAPVAMVTNPTGLCGSFHQSSSTFTTAVDVASDTDAVTLTVTNGTTSNTLTNPTYLSGVATFASVAFAAGQNTLTGTAADRAGNSAAVQTAPSPCTIAVGPAPIVTFTAPTAGQRLCPASSTDTTCIKDGSGASGWQGVVSVTVSAGSGAPITAGNVTFTVGTLQLGQAAIDGSGNASLPATTTLPDGTITITATTDNIAGHGVGTGTVSVLVDSGPPDPPTGLTATVLDRRQTSFQLTWTAPADQGQPVFDYEVRAATVPITDANFDDPTFKKTTYPRGPGKPVAPGSSDGVVVRDLYIETGYYFGVAAVDAFGNRSTVASTSTPLKATFNVTLLASPTGTNQLFGATIDGSADVNGDGKGDILVATVGDTHAYMYFGATDFAPTAPSVTFTGALAGFGAAVRHIGDIDGDGMQDIAIADQAANRVLIYKGRLNWPIALADAQADYVISTDATWALTGFGLSMAPLGDFDGDGVDDFVVGASAYATRVGRVAVIYGRAGFTSFGLPDTTRSLEIGGDPSLNRSQFGLSVVGLGHFYSVTTGTTLVVSAPGLGNATSTSANEGRLYAFHGRGPGAAIVATARDDIRVGPGKGAKIGQTLVNLGPVVNSLPALGSGNVGDAVSVSGSAGSAYVLSGTAATGPLANLLVIVQSGASGAGQVIAGGGFSGRDDVVSMIGDANPDLAITSQTSPTATPATLDFIDGAKVPGLTGTVNSTVSADVHVPMPTGWLGTATGVGDLIRDVNGDTYPDFALGDQFGTVAGRVAVFW